jgi:hypothetical protein
MKATTLATIGAIIAVAGAAVVAYAQAADEMPAPGLPLAEKGSNTADPAALEKGGAVTADWLAPAARWRQTVVCTLSRPSQVQRYEVSCDGATRLDAQTADCCIPGDHWEAKAKNWDRAPNTAVTSSPGAANVFGVASRVYNYGGTPQHPGGIHAEVDCSYLHGVDVFPAASFIVLSSDGLCRVSDLGFRDEILRAP